MPITSTSFKAISGIFAIINFFLCAFTWSYLFNTGENRQTGTYMLVTKLNSIRAKNSHCMTEIVVRLNQKQTTISDTLLLQHSVFWHTCNIREEREGQSGWEISSKAKAKASNCMSEIAVERKFNRPEYIVFWLMQCCTQFKPFGNKTFCFRKFQII